ncbi:MAG: hypothetical protein ABJB05_09555 [Parafilimonas sp.]
MASIDIIEELHKRIGSKQVPKIDPNTQAPIENEISSTDIRSAIIPAVLVGFYKHTRNEEDAAKLMIEEGNNATLENLFGDGKDKIIKSIAGYSGVSEIYAEEQMKNTVSVTKDILIEDNKEVDGKTVSNFFTDQRSNILKHLPAELNLGELMNDASIDDRTNKMEGPMSGIMHTIEKVFSSTK